jgi:hypothetical protein
MSRYSYALALIALGVIESFFGVTIVGSAIQK